MICMSRAEAVLALHYLNYSLHKAKEGFMIYSERGGMCRPFHLVGPSSKR